MPPGGARVNAYIAHKKNTGSFRLRVAAPMRRPRPAARAVFAARWHGLTGPLQLSGARAPVLRPALAPRSGTLHHQPFRPGWHGKPESGTCFG